MSNANNRGRNIRLLILFGVLALMLAALWYDRAVARPGVDAAYEAIAKLNDNINTTGGNRAMTNQDVQNELKRKPSRVRTEGPYEIEVYSWMAGLPFRTHDYYAVYTKDGETRVFKTHYKIKLPLNELVPPPVTVGAQAGEGGPAEEAEAFAGPLPGSTPPAGTEDTPKGKGERKRAKEGPPEEVKAEAKEEPLGKEEAATAPEASVPPPSKGEKAGAAPAEAPAGAGAAKEKQEQPAPPPEKTDEKTDEKTNEKKAAE